MDIIERIREEVGTVDTKAYPFPEIKIMRMEMIWAVEPEIMRCFLFLSPENGKTVMDAFIWDQMLPRHYHRFRISPYCDLSVSDKQLLERYCLYDDIQIEKPEVREAIWMYHYDFPGIETWGRSWPNPLRLVHRIYHMQRSGLHKMLYESGLNWFALELESFRDYNLAGSTLTEIMDGIPKSLFKIMNTKQGVALLKDYDRRDFFQKAYLWYPELFQKSWNKFQCHFFDKCLWPKEGYIRTNFDEILSEESREILLRIGTFKSPIAYGRYLCYRNVRNALLNDIWLPSFPERKRYWFGRIIEELYKYYLAEDAEQIRNSVEKNLCRCPQYEVRDEKYTIRCPRNITEFFEENISMGSFLWHELDRVAEGNEKVLFLRETGRPEDSFLVLLISEMDYLTVLPTNLLAKCDKSFLEWLREYAISRNLKTEYLDRTEERT